MEHGYGVVGLALVVGLAGASACGSADNLFGGQPAGGGSSSSSSTSGSGGGGGSGAGSSSGTAGSGGLACTAPMADCDSDANNGCETNTDSDLDHCGGCSQSCGDQHATPSCIGGQCQLECAAPFDDCDGEPGNGCETDTESDVEHCGGCGQSCGGSCSFGQCIEACDGGVPLDESDPIQVLRAIGLCEGVDSAQWVLADGSPPPTDPTELTHFHLGHGVLDDFGPNVNPQEGTQLLALSSGTARRPTDPDYQAPSGYDKGYLTGQPTGFPKPSPACPNVTPGPGHDATGIELTLTPPGSAAGLSFDLKYYTFEWPAYVCSIYSDVFAALLSPAPANLPDADVVFDSQGNTISAHTDFIDVCACQNGPPCLAGNLSFACSLGDGELQGTGFEQHAATGWLRTVVPVDPGQSLTLRLVTYDSQDGVFDSTTLIDNWRWIDSPGTEPVTTVITNPL